MWGPRGFATSFVCLIFETLLYQVRALPVLDSEATNQFLELHQALRASCSKLTIWVRFLGSEPKKCLRREKIDLGKCHANARFSSAAPIAKRTLGAKLTLAARESNLRSCFKADFIKRFHWAHQLYANHHLLEPEVSCHCRTSKRAAQVHYAAALWLVVSISNSNPDIAVANLFASM